MKSIVVPEVDMMAVARSSQLQRKCIRGFAPRIGLTVVDYKRLDDIDDFYIESQNFRDYYRDPYNKLDRPVPYRKHYGTCGRHYIDKCSPPLMQPIIWVKESKPIICPVKYSRELNLDEGIRIGGLYDITSCIKYKR